MRRGTVFADRFEMVEEVATGGMGAVYRAHDRLSGSPVALKVLLRADEGERKRFAREARLLAELDHPGVVRYVAHGFTVADEPYLVMEWLEGRDLAAHLAGRTLDVAETIALGRRVASTLGAAHTRGVVHRDIKPGNLFLVDGALERVKVLDFGVAYTRADGPSLTLTGSVVGTPSYMAPEQARGEKGVDARADVFSLGCVLFRCLAGRAPFSGEHFTAVLAKILLEEAPRLSELRAVPRTLDDLLARMLDKHAGLRPADGNAVAEELAALRDLDALAGPPAADVRPAALTAAEQRLVSVVLVGPSAAPRDATISVAAARDEVVRLRAATGRFGGRTEELADGSLVTVHAGAGSAVDQAARAARCALALRTELPTTPIVLATGRGVLAGRLPLGEVVDRAAQLLGAASPPGVRLDEMSAGLLRTGFVLGGSGLDLLGERPGDVGPRLLGRATPCVGRDRDLAVLEATFADCVNEETARAVLVVGPAGVGKSRLRQELVRRLEAQRPDVAVWIGRGDSVSAGASYAMLAQCIRRAAGILEHDGPAARQERLRVRVGERVPAVDAGRVTEFLAELVGVPFADADSVQLRAARRDAVLMGDQLSRAFVDWLAGECAAQPVVLVLEDLHWGDLSTVKAIEDALRRLGDRPLLVLALARPEVHDQFPLRWAGRGAEIQLGELPKKACHRLVHAVLGADAEEALVERLVAQSGGNALYLEELIRAVVEGRRELPETVLAMVQARVEALEPEARRVLRAASVFGTSFFTSGVVALLGGSDAALVHEWLQILHEREVVIRRSADAHRPGDPAFAFRHALLREAAYAMLTDGDRVLGHCLAGEWLERTASAEPIVLAEHFERGAEPARAVTWYRRAAEQALAGNDLAAAAQRAARGAELGAVGEALGSLRRIETEARRWRGEHADAEQAGLAALADLPAGGIAWHEAVGELAIAQSSLGHRDRLAALGRTLLDTPAEAASDTLATARVIAVSRVAVNLLHLGERALADELFAEFERLAESAGGDAAAAGRIHQARAFRALHGGDPAAYLELSAAAAASFDAVGDLRNACVQRGNVGYASMELGAYADAETALRGTITAAEGMGLSTYAANARHNLGLVLARLARFDEARDVEEAALAAFTAQGHKRGVLGSHLYLAIIHGLAGMPDKAEVEAQAAVHQATLPAVRAYALAVLAQALLHQGRTSEAGHAAGEAMSLLDSLGGVDAGESLIRLVFAETLQAAGKVDEARAAITAAATRLRERAAAIRAELWRRSFLERVPENARTLALAG